MKQAHCLCEVKRAASDPVTHTRSVLFIKPGAGANLSECLIVRDQFTARKSHRYSIRYHFASDCEATVGAAGASGEGRIEARHKSGASLTIRILCETELQTGIAASVTEGRVSTCYAQYKPARVAVFEAEGVGTQKFLTLIFPGASDRISTGRKQATVSPVNSLLARAALLFQ